MTANQGRVRLLAMISDLDGGGAERQFTLLLGQVPRDRFDIHVCFWRPVFRYSVPEDVTVHMVEKSKAWHLVRAIRGTRRLIDELRPDLVYTQLHYVNMVTGTALRWTRHQPRWICRQVNDPRREMPHFFGVWARWALARADRVVGCSEGVRREVVEYLGIDTERTVNLDNLCDVEGVLRLSKAELPVDRPTDTFVVVHAGRMHPQKNQALLLEAFARLDGDAELWILGDGPLHDELRQQAERLGIGSRIRWLGFQSNPFPFFRAADCLALSSHFEGLPNVVIEAMVCGTPVVATRCPFGPDELIDHGETGLLVPVDDVAAFATALADLHRDPDKRRRFGQLAQTRTNDRFDLEQSGKSYVRLFESTAESAAEARA